ncbi:unnamed protein product [Agarophyton chilense]
MLRDCPHVKHDKAKQVKLIQEWRQEHGRKRKKHDRGGMRTMADDADMSNSTLFSAKFHDSLEVMVLADNGTDDNLMPPAVLKKLLLAKSNLKVTLLDMPLEYGMAVEAESAGPAAKVICDKIAHADVELRIRHGTNLLLRNVEWAVSKQNAKHVLIGRPLLEALGLVTKTILEAASNKHNGIVNVPDILPQQFSSKEGTLAKFIRDGVYHYQHGDDGYNDDEEIYIGLGEDEPGE